MTNHGVPGGIRTPDLEVCSRTPGTPSKTLYLIYHSPINISRVFEKFNIVFQINYKMPKKYTSLAKMTHILPIDNQKI